MAGTKIAFLSIFILVILIEDANSILNDALRKDFFNIYNHVALDVRDLVHKDVSKDQVKFYLFSKKNPDRNITISTDKLSNIFSKKSLKIVFIIHGWGSSGQNDWYKDLKDAFFKSKVLRKDDYAVIAVDWENPANQLYGLSALNTEDVGKFVSDLIEAIVKKYKSPLENFLLIGHSLGAHVCGVVGNTVKEKLDQSLSRIIGLDPAGPLFGDRSDERKLTSEDAEVVQVIHTDGGTFGYKDPLGTIDFYPNGGSSQPGCKRIDITDPSSITNIVTCDHGRSYEYLTEALYNTTTFLSLKCDSWNNYKANKCKGNEVIAMGDLEHKATGKFYLQTNSKEPFGRTTTEPQGFSISKVLSNLK